MPGRVIALGFFDGVHLGHAALLHECAAMASRLDAAPAAISFDLHPSALLSQEPSRLITTLEERRRLMQELCGIPELLVLHFDETLRRKPWDEFVQDTLLERFGASALVCGEDFRFGYRGEGNAQKLQLLCAELGLPCRVIPRVSLDGEAVSSTRIRSLLTEGRPEAAARLLGHPWRLTGTVVHGKGLGHTLGFPTANFDYPPELLVPAFGVYACTAHLPDGSVYPAVVNVGLHPTVERSDRVSVESWLLDFSDDLYGSSFRLDFHRFLRPEQRFDSLDALQQAVFRDAEQVRDIIRA